MVTINNEVYLNMIFNQLLKYNSLSIFFVIIINVGQHPTYILPLH